MTIPSRLVRLVQHQPDSILLKQITDKELAYARRHVKGCAGMQEMHAHVLNHAVMQADVHKSTPPKFWFASASHIDGADMVTTKSGDLDGSTVTLVATLFALEPAGTPSPELGPKAYPEWAFDEIDDFFVHKETSYMNVDPEEFAMLPPISWGHFVDGKMSVALQVSIEAVGYGMRIMTACRDYIQSHPNYPWVRSLDPA